MDRTSTLVDLALDRRTDVAAEPHRPGVDWGRLARFRARRARSRRPRYSCSRCPAWVARALWNDEYATWYASTLSPADLLRLVNHVDILLTPYYVFMHLWIDLFGDSATSLRMPSVLAMAAAAGFTALLGRDLFGSVGRARRRAAARRAARGLPLRPGGSAVRVGDGDRDRRRTAAAAGDPAAGMVAVAAVRRGTVLAEPRAARGRGDRARRALAGGARRVPGPPGPEDLAVVGRARADPDGDAADGREGQHESGAIAWIRANAGAVQQFPGKLFGATVVAAVVAATAIVAAVALWRTRRPAVRLLTVWALLPPLFCYLTFPLLHLFLYRYLLFTLPAWCLLAGAVTVGWTDRWWRGSWAAPLVTVALVAGVAFLGVPGQHAARRSPVLGEPDFRASAELVSTRMNPGDGIAYAGVAGARRAFAYELRHRRAPRDVFLAVPSQQLGTYGAAECHEPGGCVRDTARIWLVSTAPAGVDPFAPLPRADRRTAARRVRGAAPLAVRERGGHSADPARDRLSRDRHPRAQAHLWVVAAVAVAGFGAAILLHATLSAGADSAAPAPATGAYLAPGQRGIAGLAAWQQWTGTTAQYGLDFLPDDSWQTVSGPDWLLNPWQQAGYTLVLSVPMLPRPAATGPVPTLRECAVGGYDANWRTLAQRLVTHQLADTVVRPGWEFNGPWYAWAANDREADYAGCFRHLVTAMRAVTGQRFRFLWNPALGDQSFPADRAYPGDSFVDIVGVDVYDVSWLPGTYPVPADATGTQRRQRAETAWRGLDSGDHGLRFWVGLRDPARVGRWRCRSGRCPGGPTGTVAATTRRSSRRCGISLPHPATASPSPSISTPTARAVSGTR